MQMPTHNEYSKLREPTVHEEALGILLNDCTLFGEYRAQLKPSMFYEYKSIFNKMKELDDENKLTFRNVASEMRGNIETMHALQSAVISNHALPGLIKKMKKRSLQESMDLLIAKDYDDPEEKFQELRNGLEQLDSTETDGLPNPEKDFDDWYKGFEEIVKDPSKALGLITGLDELDRVTTGFHRHDLIVVGARTSIGKSAFMIEMILRLTKAGYKCAIFSLEMTKSQIYYRMMANLLLHPLEKFRRGEFPKERLNDVKQQKEFLKKIVVDDSRGVSADYIADSIRQIKRNQGLDFVVVDYLQDVSERGEQNDNQGSSLGRICRKLRKTAKDSNVAVMALSQVVRDVEKRDNKRPQSSDLSGSTGIETSADVIAMLYREEYYNENCDKKDKNIMEVNFTKQRNGKLGKVDLFYDKPNQRLVPKSQRYD